MSARPLVGYAIVSGICVVLNNLVLIASDWAGLALFAAILLSFGIVVVIGYVLHSLVTFRERLRFAAFSRYAASMAINIPLTAGILWLTRQGMRLPMVYAAPLATSCSIAANFLLSRWAIGMRSEA